MSRWKAEAEAAYNRFKVALEEYLEERDDTDNFDVNIDIMFMYDTKLDVVGVGRFRLQLTQLE